MNEVKRDNETLRQITNFQLSIENLVRGGGRRARGVATWREGLVSFLVALCQTPCLLCVGPVSGPLWPAEDRWRAQDHVGGAALQDGQVGGAKRIWGRSLGRGWVSSPDRRVGGA